MMIRLLMKGGLFLALSSVAVAIRAQPKLFPASIPGKAGFINQQGRIVIPFEFNIAGDFSEGLARVKVGDKWGYVDETGKVVIAPQFSGARSFSEGLARVQVGGDKYEY
ncbi:MAG: WG repeat-containing protein [Acidobacteriota bacterium]